KAAWSWYSASASRPGCVAAPIHDPNPSQMPELTREQSTRRCAEDEHGIEAAKRKRVRHGVPHLHVAADIRNIVEVALGVWFVEANCRRHPTVANRLNTRHSLDATAGT